MFILNCCVENGVLVLHCVTPRRSLVKAAFVAPPGGLHQQTEIITAENEISIEPGQSVTKNTTQSSSSQATNCSATYLVSKGCEGGEEQTGAEPSMWEY